MGYRPTRDMNDYLDDYESSAKDYHEMGPMWAEMVFPDDFEALKALYGGRDSQDDYRSRDEEEHYSRR